LSGAWNHWNRPVKHNGFGRLRGCGNPATFFKIAAVPLISDRLHARALQINRFTLSST
jgi:hypothetical protein